MIDKNSITGVILAGGRATRMGGVDKGLQTVQGIPMALLSLLRLSPQVGEVMINANRNLGAYESMGVPVWPDSMSGFPGPLAGFVTALERCETAYLVTVPCDTPRFPDDLVDRLAAALEAEDAEIAMVATQEPGQDGGDAVWRTQPVFCLMRADLLASLVAFTSAGNRKIDSWTALHRCVEVRFDDADAFVGANTIAELQRL
ncbi:molybdenum cofactor guanylyltransferase MobA [Pigmentiphaga litoralis]|uniref:Molybdenum cofactor guanylyltransferase n=1 Tax=Pigmentiphaga litoralis TaxID=516702 RepID=A0A7Y9LMH2_9BURK|nr:molybdenum cofactor guanylyltransferase MobA [Pigmentiphaga litoralis]NYE24156.1 molybdopterin-guanine dinucleotide biosynthesis protein A [Pigmentiphaga litoralis]NYE82230.1 molybdopterin-guanine dinucleotide biosynthesis protein A [Pigmentiphaga litoralis]